MARAAGGARGRGDRGGARRGPSADHATPHRRRRARGRRGGCGDLCPADHGDGQAGARRAGGGDARSLGALGGPDPTGVPHRPPPRGAREGAARRRRRHRRRGARRAPRSPGAGGAWARGERQDHDAGGSPPGALSGRSVTRVGFGFDLHPLVDGRPLVLGGVTVPSARGLDGHSDADVLTHAIAEALLGALALGDLGRHFPDSDPRYRGISSLALLRRVVELVTSRGGRLVNVDATVLAEAPRLAPHLDGMAKRLAETLGLDIDRVSVKAKSPEGLGLLGRREGIAAMAVASVEVAA
ncbi:MAG: 2-C-methyl-D-erythritol 2,4-cyclodiphosphate synthase [Candidatus Rokuibacteriota bacterium]|nr:MAG: 2-C-methyl-D-erythritol 2,4-cyclodiphosphate synthase [Candidatus Rokubacteria bacterium]PYN67882.1 MAG: 2-C-methyl-D-erythritol 2,4-cyclodiphosphate synthase [Candidatus Rokubacteria bacterium]